MAERNTPIATRSITPALYPITLGLVNDMSVGFISSWHEDAVHDKYESGLQAQANAGSVSLCL